MEYGYYKFGDLDYNYHDKKLLVSLFRDKHNKDFREVKVDWAGMTLRQEYTNDVSWRLVVNSIIGIYETLSLKDYEKYQDEYTIKLHFLESENVILKNKVYKVFKTMELENNKIINDDNIVDMKSKLEDWCKRGDILPQDKYLDKDKTKEYGEIIEWFKEKGIYKYYAMIKNIN